MTGMADEHTEAGAPEVTTGAPAGVAGQVAKSMTRAEQDAADRSAFLAAEMEETAAAAPAAKPGKPAAKPSKSEDENEDEEVEKDEDEDEEDDDLDLDDDEDEDEDEEPAPAKGKDDPDPELAKRLAKVQKQEKRVREQAEARERAYVQERDAFIAEWKPKIEEYNEFQKLKSQRSRPDAVLKALGYSEEDFADVSKILWGLSKEGAADPKNRDAVSRMQRDRELREETAAARREAAEVKEQLAKRDAQAEADRKLDVYFGRISKAISDETPLLKKRMELSPKSTKAALDKIAYKLAQKEGALVDPRRVVRAYEKKLDRTVDQASKLRDAKPAVQETATGKPKPKAKPAITVIDKTTTAATTKNGSLIPSREDMVERLKKIDSGELDVDAD